MPNYDEKTGIRYGVISPHSVSPYALDDVYQNGTDPHYESMCSELRVFAGDIAGQSQYPISEDLQEKIADLLIDGLSEGYENPDGQMDYTNKEYSLHVSGDNFGIFVMRSPYYTFCRECSPCAPGAGDLNTPIEKPGLGHDYTYCLGPEWFEDNKAPYRVFRVADDSEVV